MILFCYLLGVKKITCTNHVTFVISILVSLPFQFISTLIICSFVSLYFEMICIFLSQVNRMITKY